MNINYIERPKVGVAAYILNSFCRKSAFKAKSKNVVDKMLKQILMFIRRESLKNFFNILAKIFTLQPK